MSAMWQGLAGLFGGAAGQMETNRQQQLEELKARNEEARRAAAERRAGLLRNELAMDLQRQQYAFDQSNPTIRNVMQGQFGQIQGIDTAGNVKELAPMNPLLKQQAEAEMARKQTMDQSMIDQRRASAESARSRGQAALSKEQREAEEAKEKKEKQGIQQVAKMQSDYEKAKMDAISRGNMDVEEFERTFGAKPGTAANPIPISMVVGKLPEGTYYIDTDGKIHQYVNRKEK